MSETKQFNQKPSLSIAQIIFMSFGFLGIQAGFALQNGNVSRILRMFGADVDNLPAFWLVAPLVGMIVQPIIGHLSDSTWGRFGRRKPYFLVGAILSSLALILIPNSGIFALTGYILFYAAFFVALMDASFNVAMEPFRALVADNLPEKQRTLGFSIQTCLIGIGAYIGSNLPDWLFKMGYNTTSGGNLVSDNVRLAFYIGAAIFLLSILVTVFTTPEFTPEEYKAYNNITFEEKSKGIWYDIKNMPSTMRQLGLVQFFSWFALFSMWVFSSDAVARHIFHLPATDTKSDAYLKAGNLVGVCFGIYNIVSAVYALMLPTLAEKIGRRKTHALSLFAGALGLISIYFVEDPNHLWYCMIGVGMAWASILAMPYAMLAGGVPAQKMGIYMGIFNFFITLPQILNGLMGINLPFLHNGTVNAEGVLNNISLSKYLYGGNPIYAILTAGIFMALAGLSCFLIKNTAEAK